MQVKTGRVSFSDNVTSIGLYSLSYCNLSEITNWGGLTDLGSQSFTENKFQRTNIPNQITELDSSSIFGQHTELEEVYIPNSITSINSNTFSNCTNLRNIYIDNDFVTYRNLGIIPPFGAENATVVWLRYPIGIKSIKVLNDIAYIDFSSRQKEAKTYFGQFDMISDNVIVVVSFSLSKSMTSYGLRCGAAIILGQKKESVNQVKIVFEKNARATWSNINNGAMETFVDVLDNHGEEYDQERLKYVHLLKERGDIFTSEADEVGLKYYPYKEGFFVTLAMDNETRDKYHEALMANNIFTVKVNLGIRVAICSLSVEKTKGLAKKMKDILDTIQ